MTLEQVGQIIGVTKERVRQIQNKAMEKIRVELESKFLGEPAEPAEAEAAFVGSRTRPDEGSDSKRSPGP
jgi:hypothetical protein